MGLFQSTPSVPVESPESKVSTKVEELQENPNITITTEDNVNGENGCIIPEDASSKCKSVDDDDSCGEHKGGSTDTNHEDTSKVEEVIEEKEVEEILETTVEFEKSTEEVTNELEKEDKDENEYSDVEDSEENDTANLTSDSTKARRHRIKKNKTKIPKKRHCGAKGTPIKAPMTRARSKKALKSL